MTFFKRRTCLLALAISVCASAQDTPKDKKDWQQLGRYETANLEVTADSDNSHRVVFLGNSITDNWAKYRPDFFSSNGFIGRGISGQTSYQMLARFPEDVINLKPKLVVLNCATNDVAENTHHYDKERTLRNIKSMAQLAMANDIKVILTSVLPAAKFGWNPSITDSSAKIAELNKSIKALADELNVPYVDYYSPMVAGENKALNPAYSNDGVHPTESGYEVMEAIIVPEIRKIVK